MCRSPLRIVVISCQSKNRSFQSDLSLFIAKNLLVCKVLHWQFGWVSNGDFCLSNVMAF